MNPRTVAKVTIGTLLAGLSSLGLALADDRVTPSEAVAVAVASLAFLGGVFGVNTNTDVE